MFWTILEKEFYHEYMRAYPLRLRIYHYLIYSYNASWLPENFISRQLLSDNLLRSWFG